MSENDKDKDIQDLLDEIEEREGGKEVDEKKTDEEKVKSKKPETKIDAVISSHVPIDQLKFSKGNRVINKESIEELKESIHNYGLLVPIIINKKKEVLDGERRVKAFMDLSIKEIPCIVSDKKFDDASIIANFIRENLSTEQVKVILIRKIKESEKKITQEELAKMYGLSQGRISQIFNVSKKPRAKSKKIRKLKKIKRVDLPENVAMEVHTNKVQITFILDNEMVKNPMKSITNLFKEIKDFDKIVEEGRK